SLDVRPPFLQSPSFPGIPTRKFAKSKKPNSANLSLGLTAPDVLQQTIALSQSVQRIIGLSHSSDETAESINLVLAGSASVLVNLCDGDLDGSVVLGLDDTVGGAALTWNVKINEFSLVVFHFCDLLVGEKKKGLGIS
ncbi:hypothetical protein KHP62_22695, partial [Rhodobacteraceae bacterium NNCM2]|nr:hypothetical protein [Coraliihabitans acroporae]